MVLIFSCSALLQYDFETYRQRIYKIHIFSISVTTANSETSVLILHLVYGFVFSPICSISKYIQLVQRLTTGWTTEGSEFKSR
jgi:hypothetical protein